MECGGKVIVVAIPSEQVKARLTGFIPTVMAMEIAGIRMVVGQVLLW